MQQSGPESRFKPISCTATNVQPGFRRFRGVASHEQPLIKPWRCELSAFSHAYNLYFIACNEKIYVYQPTFPDQELQFENAYFLLPPVTPSNSSPPGIDPHDPHSITRLHLDYLGREEILIVACDDGDVIGYRVPEIHRVVENRNLQSPGRRGFFDDDADIGHDVRFFLHKNVGQSAWGISVHREARLIAISANTYKVTVFAYALSSPSDMDEEIGNEESHFTPFSASDDDDEDFPSPRRRDHTITLHAGANIPSVSFDNNDPSGMWLFSGDIIGHVHLWDLSKPSEPARTFCLGHCAGLKGWEGVPLICRCLNRTSVPHATWKTMFIDPRSCHPTDSLQEAFGPGVRTDHLELGDPPFLDITETEPRFSSRRSGPFPVSWDQLVSVNNVHVEDAGDVLLFSESEEESMSVDDEETDEEASEEAGEVVEEADEEADEEAEGEEEEQTDSPPVQLPQSDPQSPPIPESTPDFHDEGSGSSTPLSDVDLGGFTFDQYLQAHFLQSANSAPSHPPAPEPAPAIKTPYCYITTSASFVDRAHEARPCIIVTKEEIYLLQRPLDRTGDSDDPIPVMRNPLFPPTDNPNATGPIPQHHRQCYVKQIPELGIFIVASPAGRVGIFSLTKTTYNGRDMYGFRLDHLLPSVTEGRDGKVVIEDVWGRRLVGVAVGPVQGMLD
ncbi:hypothetical protein P280DRAFT_498710, partial [Massarina eburnea CBS 473.64]